MMPNVKQDIRPISGEEAGREILRDLAIWAENIKNGVPSSKGRKSQQEQSDMLYGLQSDADVIVYNDYRAAQEYLHTKWSAAVTVNSEAKIAWLTYMREIDMLTLAVTHDDPILADFKPEEYMRWQSLETLHGEFSYAAKQSMGHRTLIGVAAEALEVPSLTALENPLYISRFHETRERTYDLMHRLSKSELKGAPELLKLIESLEELELYPPVSQDIMRRAKAQMHQKKSLIERIMRANDLLLYGRIL